MNSWFKKDLNLQIHLHKAFFLADRFFDSVHKSFLNQTTLDLRKENWSFLNQDLPVVIIHFQLLQQVWPQIIAVSFEYGPQFVNNSIIAICHQSASYFTEGSIQQSSNGKSALGYYNIQMYAVEILRPTPLHK